MHGGTKLLSMKTLARLDVAAKISCIVLLCADIRLLLCQVGMLQLSDLLSRVQATIEFQNGIIYALMLSFVAVIGDALDIVLEHIFRKYCRLFYI